MALKVRNGKQERVEVETENLNTKEKKERHIPLVLQAYDDSHMNYHSGWEVYEVNINDIKEKANNNFIKSNIEQLAQSIKEIGLSQPIIIKSIGRDEEKIEQFEVIAGHRRLAAYKYLNDKYGDEYLKIKAYILTKEEEFKEKQIYLETNSHSRNITLVEAILNCEPEKIDFDNSEFKEEYNNLFYPDGNIPNKEKYNDTSKVNYLEKKIKDNFPNLEEISTKTVWNTYNLISNLNPIVINAILEGKIGRNKAESIAKFSKNKQPEILENILAGKNSHAWEKIETPKQTDKEERDYYKEMLKVDSRLKAFKDINLTEFNTDNWTANSKAYLKQMNKVLAEIKKLEEMPKK